MGFKIFVSHSGDDTKYLVPLSKSLERIIEMEPYIATYYPKPSMSLTRKIIDKLNRSDCMVVLLTRKASLSQWVNQEVGYFYTQQKPIIPIVEDKVQVKGLLEGIEYIPFKKDSFENAIALTIYSLRNLIPKGHKRDALHVKIKCLQCDCEYKQPLPLHRDIEERVQKNELFETECPKCGRENLFHPKTLIQIGTWLCPSCGTPLESTPRTTFTMAGRPDKRGKTLHLKIGYFECPECHRRVKMVVGKKEVSVGISLRNEHKT